MQNDKYTEYNKNTGAIYSVTECHIPPLPCCADNLIIKKASVPEENRVDIDTLEIKPRFYFTKVNTLVDGLFSMVVPIGTYAVWDNEQYYIDDGLLEIEVNHVGSYSLLLSHPCYFPMEVIVESN